MQIDRLCVELRPRSPWEAVELGTALVRRNPGAMWTPWLLASLPVFAVANAIGWRFDILPWAGVAMWWLKPVFDRIPLFVISRAVFGERPRAGDVLAAQLRWGWRPMLHYLTWRRFGAARALYLPIDLLEGGDHAWERRRVLGGSVRSTAVLLTLACVNFEFALALAALAMTALLVPVELLSESARAVWALLSQHPPHWAQMGLNAVAWAATSFVEPFYVGAGFGLYLNSRTRLEAWDVEIAFRRIRQRVSAVASVLLLIGAVGMTLAVATPAHAGEASAPGTRTTSTLPVVFGARFAPDAGFDKAVARAYADPLLSPRRRQTAWERTDPPAQAHRSAPNPVFTAIGRIVAAIGEGGLWILLAIGAIVLAATHRHWRPWLRQAWSSRPVRAAAITLEASASDEALPTDVAATARRLWHDGRARDALALLYRASVDSMVTRTGAVLVPGATEAECLRASRALRDPEDRTAFAQTVRVWQYAAYAERLPATDDFEQLLGRLVQRFGWAA